MEEITGYTPSPYAFMANQTEVMVSVCVGARRLNVRDFADERTLNDPERWAYFLARIASKAVTEVIRGG